MEASSGPLIVGRLQRPLNVGRSRRHLSMVRSQRPLTVGRSRRPLSNFTRPPTSLELAATTIVLYIFNTNIIFHVCRHLVLFDS